MKVVLITLITVVLSIYGMGLPVRQRTNDQELSDADSEAVRELVLKFTTRFAQTKDLAPVINELYLKDFLQRYISAKSNVSGVGRSVDLDFVPGLTYNSRLHAEAGPEDWLRFYTAANNFMFFGFMSAIKKQRNGSRITAADLYPPNVIELLNTNANLSNMIVRKGSSKAVGSVDEMRKATAILEQAVSLMRQKTEGEPPLKLDGQELMKAMKEDEFFKPIIRTIDSQFFGFDEGTKIIVINTPLLFRLILVKTKNNKLEILWAEPTRGA